MRVVVAQEPAAAQEDIRKVLLGMGLECGPGDCVGHADLSVRLAQNPTDLVLIRTAGNVEQGLVAVRQALPLTRAPILVSGPAGDAALALRYLQAGVREFLDDGQLGVELEKSLGRLKETGEAQHEQGFVVGVVSASPGAGATTVAINLAFALAETYANRVALLEFGRSGADLALALDLTPRHTVSDVHQDWDRLDARLLKQSMLAHPGGVQILAERTDQLTPPGLSPAAVRKSTILLRTAFAASVVDMGCLLGEEHTEALRLCDAVALVVRLDVPCLRHTRRLKRHLVEERGVPGDRVWLIANRYGQRGQVAWKQAQEAVGGKFDDYLPDDPSRVIGALNEGQPVVRRSRHAGVSRRVHKLARKMIQRLSRAQARGG